MRRLTILIVLLFAVFVPLSNAQSEPVEFPALQDGDEIEARFEDEITTHLYAFNASAGDAVTISMTQASNDLDPYLILFDSDGAIIAVDDDSGEVNFAAEIADTQLDNDGVYFVLATSAVFADAFETETDDELPYLLTISGQTTPGSVEDTDVATIDVELLSIGDTIEGESTIDAPFNLFYLGASAGDDVIISIEDAAFFSLLYVFAPDGNRLAADASLAELSLEDDGAYMIVATGQFFRDAMDDDALFEGGNFTLVIQ